ncbi:hypothetical protein CIHG_06573 [Coccidioides immitis H538.4]|uniref:Uncharacterized protein n=2 Tax=Coccidioides immitis TaxID=5501 RepID=A0A0J8RWZ5_COCIT|nr:hypothetical protein CIRG_07987 [Coccidioides immitis RMSCC 2394]KMU88634.1 hypothetical protein CIHG_06573 [Coccidioides immitis H538.4]
MAGHRHHASLEGIIRFSRPESLPANQRTRDGRDSTASSTISE